MAITMKSAALVALVCLLLALVEGQRGPRVECMCSGGGVNRVNPKLIAKVDIYDPSISCPNKELIVTLKNKDMKCLNPESPFAKIVMKRYRKNSSLVQVSSPVM